MIRIEGNDIFKNGQKIGWIEGNHLYNSNGHKLGYFEGNDVFDVDGRKTAFVDGGNIFSEADGKTFTMREVKKEILGSSLPDLGKIAIYLLFRKQ